MNVAVFGSNTLTPGSSEEATCSSLGHMLAQRGFVICNGGYGGTMTAVARGARQADGHTIGITLAAYGTANQWIAHEIACSSIFERLRHFFELAHGFIVLWGGTGTLLELCCYLDLYNKGLIPPRPLVVFGNSWDSVLSLVTPQLPRSSPNPCFHFAAPLHIRKAFTAEETVETLTALLDEG